MAHACNITCCPQYSLRFISSFETETDPRQSKHINNLHLSWYVTCSSYKVQDYNWL